MTERPRSKVSSVTDLVEVIPTLLGFHPEESLVVLAIQHGELVVTARADARACEQGLAPALSSLWRRYPAALFFLFGFCRDADAGWRALERLADEIPAGTPSRRVLVDEHRWYGARDTPGVPYDRLGNVHLARAAFAGRPVRGSRAELVALIQTSSTPEQVCASLERVEATLKGAGDLRERAAALIAGHQAAPRPLTLDEVTLLSLASHDDRFLDEQLWALTPEQAGVHQQLWLQVVRGSVPSCRGGALVALGLTSWLCGEGALQVVCLEALGKVAGPPAWIDLLDLVNAAALSPQHWDALVAGHRDVPAAASGF